MKYILAIDQGTTSSRVIIFDQRGNIICKKQKQFNQIYSDNKVEQDATMIYEDLVNLICNALDNVSIDYKDILGVGITNQRETTVIWDKLTGKPIYNAISWQSAQSQDICNKYIDYEDLIYNKTGLIMNPYFSGTKIKWILENVAGAKEKMNNNELMFGTIDSWLIYKLTGKHYTDVTNASRTMLFNINTLSWDSQICDILDININMLPNVVACDYNIGQITEPRLQKYGKLEICGVAGDQQASLIGHACFKPGDAKITYGTGSFMLSNIGSVPTFEQKKLITTIAYNISGDIKYAKEGSVFIAGSAFQFIKDNLDIVKELNENTFAQKSSNGVVFVPALTGLGAPHWNSNCKGAIYGLTRSTTKADIAWATIEGVAYMNADVIFEIEKETNIKPNSISVDGGASLNADLMQVQANVINTPIKTISTSEVTSLGIYYLVGLNKGLFKSIDDVAKCYKASYSYEPNKDMKLLDYNIWKKAVKCTMEF